MTPPNNPVAWSKRALAEQLVELLIAELRQQSGEVLAAGFGDLHGLERRAVVRQARPSMPCTSRGRSRSAPSPIPSDVDLARTPGGADVLQHRERLRALAALGPVLLRQAHQALVLALVVPVRQEHGQQAQRVDVRARRAALLRIDQIELEERPAFDFLGFDRTAVVLALDGDPFEVLVNAFGSITLP